MPRDITRTKNLIIASAVLVGGGVSIPVWVNAETTNSVIVYDCSGNNRTTSRGTGWDESNRFTMTLGMTRAAIKSWTANGQGPQSIIGSAQQHASWKRTNPTESCGATDTPEGAKGLPCKWELSRDTVVLWAFVHNKNNRNGLMSTIIKRDGGAPWSTRFRYQGGFIDAPDPAMAMAEGTCVAR